MATLRAGSVVRYQANVVIPADGTFSHAAFQGAQVAVQASVMNAAQSKSAQVVGYNGSFNSDGNGNVQANILTSIDRGSINDLRGDIDRGIQSINGVSIRGSAIQLTSPGGQVPGTIPAPIQGDTHHDSDTIIGTAGSFWFDQLGQQVTGAVKALSEGSPMMWLGIGVVALILFSRK